MVHRPAVAGRGGVSVYSKYSLTHSSRRCHSLMALSMKHCQSSPHSVMITCWSCSTESWPAIHRLLNGTPNSVNDCFCLGYSKSHVRRLNERDVGLYSRRSSVTDLVDLGSVWRCTVLQSRAGAAFLCIQSIHWIPSKSRLWLYFNVFRKSDLWQEINDAILHFFSAKSPLFWL